MQAVETIRLRGSLRIALLDPNNEVVRLIDIPNTVVNNGRAFVLKQLNSVNHDTTLNISHLAIGSSTTAPATSQTALGGEVTRKSITSIATAELTANPPNYSMVVSFATNEGNTTLAEVALLNSVTAGTMFSRATFASFVKATSNALSITYTVSS
jgi:hypothetical protein